MARYIASAATCKFEIVSATLTPNMTRLSDFVKNVVHPPSIPLHAGIPLPEECAKRHALHNARRSSLQIGALSPADMTALPDSVKNILSSDFLFQLEFHL